MNYRRQRFLFSLVCNQPTVLGIRSPVSLNLAKQPRSCHCNTGHRHGSRPHSSLLLDDHRFTVDLSGIECRPGKTSGIRGGSIWGSGNLAPRMAFLGLSQGDGQPKAWRTSMHRPHMADPPAFGADLTICALE